MKNKTLLLITILTFTFWACNSTTTKKEDINEEPEITIEEEYQEILEETNTETEKNESFNIEKGIVNKLSAENFNEFISNDISIIDFYADWCKPCLMMSPIVEEFAKNNQDIKVGKINIDMAPESAAKYGISSIPCFIIFKDGMEIHRFLGNRELQDFNSEIKNNIK